MRCSFTQSAILRRQSAYVMKSTKPPYLSLLNPYGRLGFIKDTRELVVGHRIPFTLIYRESNEAVEILHVWHQARNH